MARAQTDSFIPLSAAWWEFAPEALKAAYRDFERFSAIKRFLGGDVDLSPLISSPFEDSPEIFSINPNVRSMQKYVVDELLEGNLEARGLRTHRLKLQKTEAIPGPYFKNAKIDWHKNAVVKFGIRFEVVEVRRLHIMEEACVEATAGAPSDELLPEPAVDKKRGRPSAEDRIVAAIKALEAQRFDFAACNRKTAYEGILGHLRKAGYDTSKGFSESVLNRCITRHLLQK